MKFSNRQQWSLLLTGVIVFFAIVFGFGYRNRGRDVFLPHYPTQSAAVTAALMATQQATIEFPHAATITVHFTGPYPIPKISEEVFSYNQRLGALLAYLNLQQPKSKAWKLSRVVCAGVDAGKLVDLAKNGNKFLNSPQSCGCEIQPLREIGGQLPPTANPAN